MRSADEIRADLAVIREALPYFEPYSTARVLGDVPALLAEVEQLRERIAAAVPIAEHWACDHDGFDQVLAALLGNPRSQP